MPKIFGSKENATYVDRIGAYLIPFCDHKVGVVQTPKGLFLLGGGLKAGEGDIACIERECIEEIGYTVAVEKRLCSAEAYVKHTTIGYFHPVQAYYTGRLLEKIAEPVEQDHRFLWVDIEHLRGKLHVEMQNWALQMALESKKKG